MESPNLRQAIQNLISTSHEVRRLLDFIDDLPLLHKMNLLSYESLVSSRLTFKDVESLLHRLTHGTYSTDIDNGILGDPEDEDAVIIQRLKHLRRKLKDRIFIIPQPEIAYGTSETISNKNILCAIMDEAEAYDYVNVVGHIFKEWNLTISCIESAVSEREDEVNPKKTSTPKKNTDIWNNKDLLPILEEAVNRKFLVNVEGDKKGFKWLRSNPLLAYFVRALSLYMNLSEKLYDDKDSVNWSYFSGVFQTKRQGGDWDFADGEKLHDYMYGNKRGKTVFEPKGYKEIEDLMLDFR